jgi:hypothetical protein
MTRRPSRRVSVFIFIVVTIVGMAAAQKAARLAGTWDVNIQHESGRVVNEQWVIEQDGNKVKGTVKTVRQEYPLEGTLEGNKIDIRVTVSEERHNVFLGTVDGDSIKGSIKQAGDDGTFSERRASAASR